MIPVYILSEVVVTEIDMINLFVSVFLLLRKYKCILKFKVINVFG